MHEELARKLKYLRLQNLLSHWDDFLQTAAQKNLSHARLLETIVDDECRIKEENARRLRLQKARIPETWLIETYPFDRQRRLNKKKIMALYDSETYLQKAQNIIWLGPTGCGKTGLATAFLIQAIGRGYTARHVLFADLVEEFYRAAADRSEGKLLKRYGAYDLLLVDEIGYIEVEAFQVAQFFTLMQRRHHRKSTLFTSNLGFADWGSFLKSDHLTVALLDRLTENSHVFNMKDCVSLRTKLRETK